MLCLKAMYHRLNMHNNIYIYIYKFDLKTKLINIYHKGCGTIGVPLFASENIKLTFAINFKKYRR